ncbi:zinc finger, CCHC-type containing protein [Tanacetum coccineum]
MAGNMVKEMTTNFRKLDKFEGHDFRRWQKKMHFLLTTLKVVYVMSTPIPELMEDDTLEAIRRRAKWENDDYICRGHILNEDTSSKKFLVDEIAWWIDSGATTHVCKDRCWFKTYEPVEDGSVLYMGDIISLLFMEKENLISGPVLNKCGYKHVYEFDKYILSKSGVFVGFGYYNNGMFMLNLNKVPDDSGSVYMSSSTVVNSSLWHARLGDVHYKRMLEMSKDDLIPVIDKNPEKYDASRFCYVYLLQAKDEALDKFRIYKTKVELQQNDLIKTLRMDRGGEYYDHVFFQSVGTIHETTAAYTPQQNGVAERKELLRKWAVVRLPDPRRKTIGEKSIDCIFVGYDEHSKAYSIEEDPKTYNEAMQSREAAFWKEAINDEIGSIIENNTWVLSDLPPGCKWIFKRKMKVDGTIDKFKARLVIQGFRQKEGIDYFDTYAPVACITTIRLLLALAAIHNLVIHQMDVKRAFLNGDLEEEVYMKQPEGIVMPGNDHKACKLVKSLFGLKLAPKQWHQKFDEVVLSSGFLLTNLTSVYIANLMTLKILKKFNHEDCSPMSTPMDPVEKLKPNTGKPVDQLEYSRAIGCLMYVMTSTRPDIAYAVVLEAYSDASWTNHVEDSSSTSGWVFLLEGGAIS